MHYKNGRKAEIGDKIVGKDVSGNPVGGFLSETFEGSESCNGNVILTGAPTYTVTLGDCLHVDDLESGINIADDGPTDAAAGG